MSEQLRDDDGKFAAAQGVSDALAEQRFAQNDMNAARGIHRSAHAERVAAANQKVAAAYAAAETADTGKGARMIATAAKVYGENSSQHLWAIDRYGS